MKKLLLTLAAAALSFTAMADEGMWLLPYLQKMNIKDMKAKGCKLSAEDIYSVNKSSLKDAIVIFGGGCTGEIVSDKGLIFTNHHCGYGSIQALSSVEHDYLKNGFWASSHEEELPCPGLSVKFVRSIEDVTADILGNVPSIAAEKERQQIIRENIKALTEAKEQTLGESQSYNIVEFFGGNQYFAFVYEVFNDVRLVGTPPSSIGKFGGDTDNWVWPRHTGDFSIFRVYANAQNEPADYSKENVPYRPARHFKVSTKGVEEGDFTMIYGFPGNTQEYITSDAVEYVAEVSNPMKIALRTIRLEIIAEAQSKDVATRIAYAAKHANIANAWKKWQGESLGLAKLGTIQKKREYEKAFAEWAADKPQYAHLLDSMHAAYKEVIPHYFARELFNESILGMEFFNYAYWFYVNDMRGEKLTADKQAEARKTYLNDYRKEIDHAISRRMLSEYMARMPKEEVPAELQAAIEEHGSPEAFIDHMFAATRLLTQYPLARELYIADPMVKFASWFADAIAKNRNYAYRNLSNVPAIEKWYRTHMQALREWDKERAFYPDANFTLRVAYGTVTGYENADGEYHTHQTTLDGIIAKDNPEIYDYDIPQSLRDIYQSKDYGRWAIEVGGRKSVPVCFLASNHTTGGNSGSPVLNGKGELIGINFDRTWRSTMSDIEFDPTICRNISVDIRYVLFVMDRIGGAGYLLEEMDIK